MKELHRVLSSDILSLHPLEEEHRDELYSVASDPLIWKQHPKHDRWKKEKFYDFFDLAMDSGLAFIAIDKSSDRMIGSSRFKCHNLVDTAVEIGWTFLARSYWGGKWNTEMKRLMISHAHQYFSEVLLCIDATNKRSSRAAEKIGAVLLTDNDDPLFDTRPNYLTYKVSKKS